jgi:hypothetical protein
MAEARGVMYGGLQQQPKEDCARIPQQWHTRLVLVMLLASFLLYVSLRDETGLRHMDREQDSLDREIKHKT